MSGGVLRQSATLFVVALMVMALSHNVEASKWDEVSKKVATLLPGVFFSSSTTGWVSGFGFNTHGPAVLFTQDGGAHWNESTIDGGLDSLVFMSVAFSGSNGLAAGFGLPVIPGIAVSSDSGLTWTKAKTSDFFESTFLDVQALDSQNMFAFGQWSDLFDRKGQGVQVSTDGQSFSSRNWAQANAARYGHFINSTFGWVSGGNVFSLLPQPQPQPQPLSFPRPLDSHSVLVSHDLIFEKGKGLKKIKTGSDSLEGVIARTMDGGRNWKQLFNSTANGYNCYFNGITFTDSNNGWAVARYKNLSSGHDGSFIFFSKDGGNSWSIQLQEDDLHLFRVRMLDSKNGWAVGFKSPDLVLFSANFYRTSDGGKRWEKSYIDDVLAFDISPIDTNTAFATGLGLDFSSNIYKWTS